jgi:arylsulfatase
VASSDWQGVLDMSSYRVQALRSVFETLPQALKKVGYSTAYLQSNAHGRPEFGYGRGFDFTRILSHYPAHLQVTDALEWMTNQPHQPFFLFIHEIDPHGPYVANDGFFMHLHGVSSQAALERLDPAERRRVQRYVDLMDIGPKVAQGVQGVSEEANRYIQMRYDAEIYQVNMRFKRLLTFLERAGISENTLIAITSDHGEAFGEKGYYGHGHSLAYDELVHVPLIMAGAGLPRNVRVPHTTSTLDFYPTLLELAGAEPPSYIPGSPMFASNGKLLVDADRIAYVDLDKKKPDYSDWDAAIVKDNYKVATHNNGATHWIFDRENDPGENDNLANTGRLPEDVERKLIAELQTHVQRYEKLSREFGEPEWMEAHDGHKEDLKALGYI